jgi:hypothetical protein
VTVAAPEAHRDWALGAQALLSTGIAPAWTPAVGIFLERTFSRAGAVSPSVRATLQGAQSSSDTARGDLEIRVAAARLEACPVNFRAGAIDLRPCAGIDVGIVAAEGSGPGGTSDAQPWLDVVAHARLGWVPTAAFGLEAQFGPVIPVTRYEIQFLNPSETVHRPEVVGLSGGVGASVRWE